MNDEYERALARYNKVSITKDGQPEIGTLAAVIEVAVFCVDHGMGFGHNYQTAAGAIAYGRSIGKSAFWSLKNIAIVRDKPTIWGEGLKALATERTYCGGFLSGCYSGPEVRVFLAEQIDGDPLRAALQRELRIRAASVGEKQLSQPSYLVGWSVTVNKDTKIVKAMLFDILEANEAGIGGGNMYRKWPRRMLMHRAFSFLVKDFYPEVMIGAMTTEEAQDEAGVEEARAKHVAASSRSVDDIIPEPLPADEAPIDVEYEEAENPELEPAPQPTRRSDDEKALLGRLKIVQAQMNEIGVDAKSVLAMMSQGRSWRDLTLAERRQVVERAEAADYDKMRAMTEG